MREDLAITQSAASSLTARQALHEGAGFLSRSGIESARLDAEILLAMVLGRRREELYVNFERPLAGRERSLFRSALERRGLGEPVAYLTGQREFWSLDFLVTADVLVPRPETELVVEVAIGLMEAEFQISDRKFQILDLGTGSGNIAVSLAMDVSNGEVWATDLSCEAIRVAGTNALRHGVKEKIHLLQGDAFEPIKEKRDFFHMIVSNPPYVRRGEIPTLPRDVRDWEPISALDGGIDGLDFYRPIAAEGQLYLKERGFIVVEIGDGMAEGVLGLLAAAGSYSAGSV
ncbi:MAG: peptide chain release factor N(5)-glutamine methyltransferase, partial [Candidatus Binatia bacterium]